MSQDTSDVTRVAARKHENETDTLAPKERRLFNFYVILNDRAAISSALNWQIQTDQIFSFKHFIIDDINYQLNFSIYVATGGYCYATLIKTDIQLISLDRLVYREI